MPTRTVNRDRARGALLGLAVGDALGTTLEFSEPAAGRDFTGRLTGPHVAITGGGPFEVVPGQVTDDTQMACCLAASLADKGKYDADDVARRYIEWSRIPPFDIGHTTATAIALLARGVKDTGRQVWEQSGRKAAANGSLMRCAPIGVFFRSEEDGFAAAFDDSALTHFDPRCQLACAVLTGCIRHAVDTSKVSYRDLRDAMGYMGEGYAPVLRSEIARTNKHVITIDVAGSILTRATRALMARHPDLQDVIVDGAAQLGEDLDLASEPDPQLSGLIHKSQGFVRVAFRLAFWELVHSGSYEEALIDCVNRGGDSDTNGAITGALLGAQHGERSMPKAWRDAVTKAKLPAKWKGVYEPRTLFLSLPEKT